MELVSITLRFESPEEQKYVEEHVANFATYAHETWPEGSVYKGWTEFDIRGCEPHDVQEALDEVMEMWESHKAEAEVAD